MLPTFWTPYGRYRFLRMPFGINCAPEIFQMRMQALLKGLKGVEVLVDDILIYGSGDTLEEALINNNTNLENLFIRLRDKNCKLNKDIFWSHVTD